jgi:hypothetical protein
MKKIHAFVLACLGALFLAGCGHIPGPVGKTDRYYLYRPSLIEQANPWLTDAKRTPGTIVLPKDKDVLIVVNDLTNVLRGRLNLAMGARHISSFAQVATAAAAAVFTTLRPEERILITILAASSALMPQLQSVFDAKGRAEAYKQGVEMLDKALGAYVKAVQGKNIDPASTLTREGTLLFEAAVAAIEVVEKLTVAQLPTPDQIKAAKGEFIAEFSNQVMQSETKLLDGLEVSNASHEASVADMQPDSVVFSSATDVVVAKADTGKVVLSPGKPGKATVTAIVEKDGKRRTTTIPVTVPLKLKEKKIQAKEGAEVSIETEPRSNITGFSFSEAGVLQSVSDSAALPAKPESAITVKAVKAGTVTVRVFGEYGISSEVVVEITK